MKVEVRLSGNFFRSNALAVVTDAVDKGIADTVAEGERAVKAELYAGHGVDTGHYRRSVHGEMVKSLHGIIHDSKVIYGPWLEGVSSRNQTSRFKGYAMFRKAHQQLQRKSVWFLVRRIHEAMVRLN